MVQDRSRSARVAMDDDDDTTFFDERAPLLQFPGSGFQSRLPYPAPPPTHNAVNGELGDLYQQFCHLVGLKPVSQPPGQVDRPKPETLYYRATRHRRNQNRSYMFTATLTNTLLMSQVVLGAALTGLGASDSSRVLITVFGALNTVIAGMIAYLKSRGQPMRSRMFRDDLERVVDEIENSATMWYGISRGAHGYDAIDVDEHVTVRSEVARLTRLYDRAVKANTLNDPDMYAAGGTGDPHSAALRANTGGAGTVSAVAAPASSNAAATPVVDGGAAVVAADSDESPATTADHPAKADAPKSPAADVAKDDSNAKGDPAVTDKTGVNNTSSPKTDLPGDSTAVPASNTAPTPAVNTAPPVLDDDESPATAAHLPEARKDNDSQKKASNGKIG